MCTVRFIAVALLIQFLLILLFYSCLTVSPSDRADSIKVAEHIADILMRHLDSVRKDASMFEKKLEHEKRRSKK